MPERPIEIRRRFWRSESRSIPAKFFDHISCRSRSAQAPHFHPCLAQYGIAYRLPQHYSPPPTGLDPHGRLPGTPDSSPVDPILTLSPDRLASFGINRSSDPPWPDPRQHSASRVAIAERLLFSPVWSAIGPEQNRPLHLSSGQVSRKPIASLEPMPIATPL